MLGDSRPRSNDQIGDVLVAERCSEKDASRLFDSKVGREFEKRERDAFMKSEIQETGASQQHSIPLPQVVLMKLLEYRFGPVRGDCFEIAPAQTADSAIMIRFTSQIESIEQQWRELRYWAWRK